MQLQQGKVCDCRSSMPARARSRWGRRRRGRCRLPGNRPVRAGCNRWGMVGRSRKKGWKVSSIAGSPAISGYIEKWEKVIPVIVNDFGIKSMKTKWGTCNIEAKRIWLNLELAKKPLQCLEYIVVHEMVHLLERRHNDRFIGYLNKYMPQWKKYKEELNSLPVSHLDWEY